MSSTTTRKCRFCRLVPLRHPQPQAPAILREDTCRKASKAARQAPWLAKPENRNYFRGSANCERVRQWRLANPGHSRRKTTARPVVLQDVSNPQSVANETFAVLHALPVTRRLAAATRSNCGTCVVLTGHVLQDDWCPASAYFISRGLDILGCHAAR